MHHFIAYDSSAARNYAYGAIAAITDASMTPRGTGYIVPTQVPNIAAVYVAGTHLLQAQLRSPSLGANWNFDIEPLQQALVPTSPPPYDLLNPVPVPLKAGEELDCYGLTDQVAAQRLYGGVILCDGPLTQVGGRSTTIRATSATTLVADTWSLCPLTFPTPLPADNYTIVGARFHSAGVIFGRLVIPGYPWRPGCVGFQTVQAHDFGFSRHGNLGVWGTFNVASPPQAEFLSVSNDTTEVVELDLVATP